MPGSIASPRALPPLPELALRFALVSISLFIVSGLFGTAILKPVAPMLGGAVAALNNEFLIHDTTVDQTGKQPFVVFRANLRDVQFVGGRIVYPLGMGPNPDGWFVISLTTGGILQHALFFLIIVLAWPGTRRELALRGALAIPVAAALVLQHVAVTVLAELWFPIHDKIVPQEFWPLLAYSRFLMGGGGLVFAIALAALIIALASRTDRRAPA